MANKIINLLKPAPKPKQTQQGAAGYDNPRENIDPHVKTQVVTSKQGSMQDVPLQPKDIANKEYVDSAKYDRFLGTNCTGADKTANRTLDVPNGIGQVFVERKFIHPIDDYTVSGTTITFLMIIDNRYKITVIR